MHHSRIYITLLSAVWLIHVQTFEINTKDNESLYNCSTESGVMLCEGSIPVFVPLEVKSLKIIQLKGRIQEHFAAITRSNWTHIRSLTIQCINAGNGTLESLGVQSSAFKTFSFLKELKISCHHLGKVSKDAFLGLDNLNVLDLSDCDSLSVANLTAALEGNKLTSLTDVIVHRLSLFIISTPVFSQEFFYSLRNKPIHHLDLSGTKDATMHKGAFSESLPQLVEFNVSGSGFLALDFLKSLHLHAGNFHNLRIVDLSFPMLIKHFFNEFNLKYWQSKYPLGETFVQNLTHLYVQGFVPDGIRTKLVSLDVGQKICLFIVFIPFNVSLLTYCLLKDERQMVNIQRMNVAHNGLEDIDPSFTYYAAYTKYVDVSHNRLNRMHSTRFEKALYHNTGLTEIYMSHNSLHFIPYGMFINTKMLQIIDLSNNNLESVVFKLDHLHHLRVLKLDNNKIHTLNAQNRMAIDQLIRVQTLQRTNRSTFGNSLNIPMSSNPFVCSCDNKEFIEWIISTREIQFSSVCSFQGDSRQSVCRR